MRTLAYLLPAAMIGLLPSSVRAEDGNSLLKRCAQAETASDGQTSGTKAVDVFSCFGYVQGVIGLNSFYQHTANFSCLPEFCPPEKVPNIQAVRVLVKYLKEHPANLDLHETVLTVAAFRDAWPCRSPKLE